MREWIDWNAYLFGRYAVRCIIVSDVPRLDLPEWCRVAVYPYELPLFSLAKTSNYGIRLAGGGIVCKTDPDCVFSEEVLNACLRVTPFAGISPEYAMADSFETRHAADYTWQASKGTMCLHFEHWKAICGYDERMEGYGIEDGECFHRAKHAQGRTVERVKLPFWHIAHSSAHQARGRSRKDCWNRDIGFNPKNHKFNQSQIYSGVWAAESWGRPQPE